MATSPDMRAAGRSGGLRAFRWAHLLVQDGSYRRHASDAARLVTAILTIAFISLITRFDTSMENSVGAFAISLPPWLRNIFDLFYAVGSTVGVAVLVLIAVLRRWRLVWTIVVSGAVALVIVALLHAWLDSGASSSEALADVRNFPLPRIAFSTATLLAVRPHLVRPLRRVVEVLLFLAVFGALFVPAAMPFDVLAGFMVGSGAAALVALALGSPEGTPTIDEARATLGDLGLAASDVIASDEQEWGEERYDVTTGDGDRLDVTVIGRDARSAQILSRTTRSLWYRDAGPAITLDRAHRVDQIGLMMMLARARGAAVPEVVAAGLGGADSTAVLVSRKPEGKLLAEVDPADVTDELLADLWRSVLALRDARIAHGALDSRHIVVDGDHATLIRFTQSSPGATPLSLDGDVAQLLVTQSVIVGPERAIDSLREVLGMEAVEAALPLLQPAVVNNYTRKSVADISELLNSLRDVGSSVSGKEPPKLTELRRVTVGSVVVLALSLVGIWMIIGLLTDVDWDDFWDSLESAQWGWVLFGLIVSITPAITDAMASRGGLGPELPMGPLTMLNIGGKFLNIAVPSTVGQAAINIRFAQRYGIATGAALSGGIVISVSGFVVQALTILYGLLVGVVDLDLSFDLSSDDVKRLLLIGALILGVIGFTFWSSRRLRRWYEDVIVPQAHEFKKGLQAVTSDPRRVLLLFGGNLGSQVLYGLVLCSALLAFGADGDLLMLAIVANTSATLLGGLSPVPGGIGLWEGTAVTVLAAGGIDTTTATVAVLTHRILTYYAPPIWGYFGFVWLRRNEYL